MNVKETVEAEIVSNGMDGEGIARVDGKVLFVPYTLKGERVLVAVKSVKSKYAVGKAAKILQPSPYRVTPRCLHYFNCGGCDTGHITSQYRKEILLSELKNNLRKIAGIDYSDIEFVECDEDKAFRNKISMPFATVGGKTVLGLYRSNSHTVEPVDCAMQHDSARAVAETVCGFANERGLSVYNETSGSGILRHLVLRAVGGGVSAMLVVNTNKAAEWEKQLASRLPEYCDFFICPNTRRNNVIVGDTVRLVKGKAKLPVNVLGVKAELSPLSFFQVNDHMRDKLYTEAIGAVGSETLIDLYSGIGITSNLAAAKCKKIIAVECVPQAVKDADATAELNCNADKIENICGDTERVLGGIDADGENTDVLVDPPRKGCGAAVMNAIADIKPQRLIYISCNHATMCRDIKLFRDRAQGYEISVCKAFDMFPNTHHVETLCVLERKGGIKE